MLVKKRLFTPGPTMIPDRVQLAISREMIHHRKPEFKKIMNNSQVYLKKIFGTDEPVIPLSSSGTGAMAAAVSALFTPEDKLIVIDAGKFGERWAKICDTENIEYIWHKVNWGEAVDPDEIQSILDENPDITGVLSQLSETSTGVLHPVRKLANITRKRDVLLVVDGISGVSLSPCPMSEWGIDCLLTGSQKGLMLPPGLALIALSSRAWEKAEKVGTRNFYFDLLGERKNILKDQTNYTAPVSLILGLMESLIMFEETGLENIYRKQWALTMLVRTSIKSLGLELFAKDNFAWGVTSCILPEGVIAQDLIAHASDNYGAVIASGQDHMRESMLRIGHMGWVDYADILGCLHALATSFVACGGYLGCRNFLELGMEAYEVAMRDGAPTL